MSGMNTRNQAGSVNALLLPLIAAIVLLLSAAAFSFWAYGGRQDYKNNVDAKINVAVVDAQKAESAVKEKEFAERDKNPLRTYAGPSEFGSVVIQYPRTWSGYVADNSDGSPFVDGYWAPGVVPDTQADTSVFALRMQVVQDSYSSLLEAFMSNAQDTGVSIQPYSAPKVPKVIGSRIEGKITDTKTGTMVLLPLRDKTLQIWTESDQFKSDFNNIILPNLTFSP